MNTCILLIVGYLLAPQANVQLPDGVYAMCMEVSGFSGETIELKNGRFRYWFYSDVVTDRTLKYPLDGAYRISGNMLILENDKIHSPKRTIAVVNGVDVLWRQDGLEFWEKDKRVHPYAVLIRIPAATDGSKVNVRPSIKTLHSKEMADRGQKEYEERYKDQPTAVRALLGAQSLKNDPEMATYKREVARAREKLDPALIRQLIALMGNPRTRIEAQSILTDIYSSGWLIKEEPPFLKEKDSKKRALGHLIDGLTASRDRYALEDALLLFLRVSGVGEIDLPISEAGVRLKLSTLPNGGYSTASSVINNRNGLPKTTLWTDEMKDVIPAVQKWMRDQLAK